MALAIFHAGQAYHKSRKGFISLKKARRSVLFSWSECRDSNPRPLGPELNHTCLILYYCVQKVLILCGFHGIIVL